MSNIRYTLAGALIGTAMLMVGNDARADFVVKSSQPAAASAQAASTAPVSMAPIVDPQDIAAKADHPRKPFHWRVATGFGDDVPLGFACKQIVPPAVRVSFGPGARPTMLVTWQGGQGWNLVLRDAVKPLGLKLVMSHMAVEIRK